ncbi:MAG: hypothetical protein ACYC96_06635 [Fimbriimonadaceae bacterium]
MAHFGLAGCAGVHGSRSRGIPRVPAKICKSRTTNNANPNQSWTYDAAGNRASDYTGTAWTYDNLNRMSVNGAGTALTNDILGKAYMRAR